MFGKKVEKSDDSKLLDEKSALLEEKISQNIIVHKMPKNYKAGTFSYDEYFNREAGSSVSKDEGATKAHVKGRKTGIIIMVVGFVVIGLLVYGAFSYIKNPGQFNILSLFPKKDSTPVVETPITPIVQAPVVIPSSTFEIVTTTEEIVTSTPEVTSTPIIIPVVIADADSDGLSDQEEAILGTNANTVDSDGDTYNDLSELIGAYNPAGSGKLVDNANIRKYTNTGYKYSVLYPKNWKLDLVDKGSSVIFTAADQSFIQVVTQTNERKMDIKNWYETEFSVAALDSQLVKYNNWDGVRSADGLIVYLTDKSFKNIYIMSYTPISDQALSYRNLFEAMIRSFTVEK